MSCTLNKGGISPKRDFMRSFFFAKASASLFEERKKQPHFQVYPRVIKLMLPSIFLQVFEEPQICSKRSIFNGILLILMEIFVVGVCQQKVEKAADDKSR